MTCTRDPHYPLASLVSFLPASRTLGQEVTCYVDSQQGDDGRSGLSEDEAIRSQAAISTSCTVGRFERGSVFDEKLAVPRFGGSVHTYTNYGPETDPLPQFRVPTEPGRGPVVLTFAPLTIDGLRFSGARGDSGKGASRGPRDP